MSTSLARIASLIESRRNGGLTDESVAYALRSLIREGEIPYGVFLPPTVELARALKANLNAVNRALRLLAVEGYLERNRKTGTMVSDPAQRLRYIHLLIAGNLEKKWFYRLVTQALQKHLTARHYTVRCMTDLNQLYDLDTTVSRRVLQQLLEELRLYPPLGFIRVGYVVLERHATLQPFFKLPNVSLHERPGASGDVAPGPHHFEVEGIEYLHERGCRRVVFVQIASRINPNLTRLRLLWQQVAKWKISCVNIMEIYDQDLGPRIMEETYLQMRALLKQRALQPPAHRFDSIIVTNEVLMAGVGRALREARVLVPEQVRVLTAAVKGAPLIAGEPPHCGLAVDRFEIAPERIAKALLHRLEQKILAPTRQRPPEVLRLPLHRAD